MTRSLADLAWWDYRSTLWWLGLLYRRPRQFREALEKLPRARVILAGLHLLSWVMVYLVALPLLPLYWFVAGPGDTLISFVADRVQLTVGSIAIGFGLGISGGVAFGVAGAILGAIALSATIVAGLGSIAIGTALGDDFNWVMLSIIGPAIAYGIAFGIGGGLALGIGRWIAVALGMMLVVDSSYGTFTIGFANPTFMRILGIVISAVIVFGIVYLRAYYHPIHLWFVWPDLQVRWYQFHPVSWDDLCSLPYPGLHRLLVAYAETAPDLGNKEIERLIKSYPSQRGQALRARTTLIAREAGAQQDLSRIDDIVASLPEGDKGYLAQTADVRTTVGEIAAAQRRLDAIDRPFMREPYASLVVKEIENFRGRVSGFGEPLSSEFRAAADKWLAIAARQLAEIQNITQAEPTPQVFRAGDPVDRVQEAFVPRLNVFGQLEREIMLASGCPGLLIYGRRRMGKSTLLRNLDGFLPSSVHITVISMLNPVAFTSTTSFIRLVVEQGTNAGLPPHPGAHDLSGFFAFLQATNAVLADRQRRLVLAFDEFEQLDAKMGSTFDQDLLSTIRESVQSHRQLIWVFAGSHHITELRNAPWPSYFVSLRTVEVPAFSTAETRLLLTEPLRESPLFGADQPRPRFDPAFWGEDGIERIHSETAGWPHLVQLLAATAVDLANDASVSALDDDMLERAAQRSITDGDMVLRQLMHGESKLSGEWDYLAGFRNRDEQPPPDDEKILQSLRHRQIIAEDGHWRLRVPLMQRWLRQRG